MASFFISVLVRLAWKGFQAFNTYCRGVGLSLEYYHWYILGTCYKVLYETL